MELHAADPRRQEIQEALRAVGQEKTMQTTVQLRRLGRGRRRQAWLVQCNHIEHGHTNS